MNANDKEKLEAAQKAVGLAQQAIKELYGSDDFLLAEHAVEMLEPVAKVNQKLKRLMGAYREDEK